MKIEIITCHTPYNYGAVLQCYATVRFIQQMGCYAEIINYQTPSIASPLYYKVIRYCLRKVDFIKCKKIFGQFLRNNIPLTHDYHSYNELEQDVPIADIYIAGSDQIWNIHLKNGNDKAFFLEFIPQNKKKISYASSLGEVSLDDKQLKYFKEKLAGFDAISVREKRSAEIFKENHICDAKAVVDPVFLLDQQQWENIQKEIKYEKYVLVYSFYRRKELYEYARKLANELHCKLYVISTLWSDRRFPHDRFIWIPSVEEFVSYFANAENVVTNSYHGVIFSIIFKKNFHVFNSITGMDRIDDLLSQLHLKDRIIEDDQVIIKRINWMGVNEYLQNMIQYSKDYLIHQIGHTNVDSYR